MWRPICSATARRRACSNPEPALKSATGTFIVHIPYRGSAPAFTDLMAGQVQLMAKSIPQAAQYVNAGKLRAPAVTSREDFAELLAAEMPRWAKGVEDSGTKLD